VSGDSGAGGSAESPWLRPERGARGPAPEYSRARIAAIAVALADQGGLAAVSMRRVAAELGTAPASLYRYLANRDELLVLMADAVAGELRYPRRRSGDALADLVELGRRQLGLFRSHPWLIDLGSLAFSLGPNAVDFLEHALATVSPLEVPAPAKLEAIAMMTGLVSLFARDELARAAGQSSPEGQAATMALLVRAVGDGRHPHLAAALAEQAAPGPVEPDELFGRVLTRVLSGLLTGDGHP
jgi:AcrR family transcriptional regulator